MLTVLGLTMVAAFMVVIMARRATPIVALTIVLTPAANTTSANT